MQKIVTGDDTWVYHYETASRRRSMEWKHTSSHRIKKSQSVQSDVDAVLRT